MAKKGKRIEVELKPEDVEIIRFFQELFKEKGRNLTDGEVFYELYEFGCSCIARQTLNALFMKGE